jgi:hypothetical protein
MKRTLLFYLANGIADWDFGNIRMTLTSPWIYLDHVFALQAHTHRKGSRKERSEGL